MQKTNKYRRAERGGDPFSGRGLHQEPTDPFTFDQDLEKSKKDLITNRPAPPSTKRPEKEKDQRADPEKTKVWDSPDFNPIHPLKMSPAGKGFTEEDSSFHQKEKEKAYYHSPVPAQGKKWVSSKERIRLLKIGYRKWTDV